MDAGLVGLLDFVGYPVGAPAYAVPAGGGFAGLSQRLLYYYLAAERERSALDSAKENQAVVQFARRVEQQWSDYQKQLAAHRDKTIFATILAEI